MAADLNPGGTEPGPWLGLIITALGALGVGGLAQKALEHFATRGKTMADTDLSEASADQARAQTVAAIYETMQKMAAENHLLRESQERMERENHEARQTVQRMGTEVHEMRSNFRILCSAFLVYDSQCRGCVKNPIQGDVRAMIDECLKKARRNLHIGPDDDDREAAPQGD